MSYVVRKEIALNMKEKPEKNVIITSSSPCARSDVFVQDGTIYFCVDYQHLNSVTKFLSDVHELVFQCI